LAVLDLKLFCHLRLSVKDNNTLNNYNPLIFSVSWTW
jgi:hypothetical protein